jgi:ubiquinone/menaquinone biosynthesis C-methylase UbiE
MKLDPRFTTKEFWANHEPYQPPTFPAARVLADQMVELAATCTELPRGALVLEVGAGNGAFSETLGARFQLVAFDLSHGLLSANPARRRVEGDVFRLPFARSTFDLVIASAMLHHLRDVAGALAEMARVSRRFVVATEPNRNNPLLAAYGLLKPEERGLLPFTAGWLARQARTGGLEVKDCFPYGWISPNKTPTVLLPLFTRLPLRHPLGLNLLLVAVKP